MTSRRELLAFDAAPLTGLDAVNLEATRYAPALAVEGFDAFAYGDNAQLNAFQSENSVKNFRALKDILGSLRPTPTTLPRSRRSI